MTQPVTLAEFMADMPRLHYWGNPPVWRRGGFTEALLKELHAFMQARLPAEPEILETGAGNSTIFFLLSRPKRLVSIDPNDSIHERIDAYCTSRGIRHEAYESYNASSDAVLPQLAAQWPKCFDFALIDGNHGWPAVFVDFCYTLQLLRRGGFIAIDDTRLHSVAELVRLLDAQPGFRRALDLSKLVVFEKVTEATRMPEWSGQPYIVSRSKSTRATKAIRAMRRAARAFTGR